MLSEILSRVSLAANIKDHESSSTFVDLLMEPLVYLGIDGLSIDSPSSLERILKVGRGKLTIIGNVDPMLFVQGNFYQLKLKFNICSARLEALLSRRLFAKVV